ncbi:MAG: MFS transporter [Anaerolineales bacterium]|nr:MFS transporter [Anaerolineales bacterium]
MSDSISHASPDTAAEARRSRAILIALMFPTLAIVMNGSMFGVALPTIRDEFLIPADTASWLAIAFSLPFMMLMPLYGRLGDELGKARLLILGVVLYAAGSTLALLANGLPLLFLGRVVQGAGSAGITPLSMAIIAERFPESVRGRAMGTWNSIAPASSIFAPTIAGYLVDHLGWRTIFVPAIFVAVCAIIIVRLQIPTLRARPNFAFLTHFDWGGTLTLAGTIIALVLWVSSRPVTGVEPLRDWRLLLGVVVFATAFFAVERRHARPLVDLTLWRLRSFRLASMAAFLRMCMMVGTGFLLPLYLADVYDLRASRIGLLATLHSVALFLSIRVGGPLADRWPIRRLVSLSLAIQVVGMIYFVLLPAGQPLYLIILGTLIHGSGAGLGLAALHRTALGGIPDEQSGAASGVYSMVRFAGSMLSTAIAGVILQTGLDSGLATIQAYQVVYGVLAGLGLLGTLTALRLRQ